MVALGVLVLIFGLVALFSPVLSSLALTWVLGALLVVAGVARVAWAFSARSFGRGLLALLMGGLMVLAGVLVFAHPLVTLATFTLLAGLYFLVDGVVEIVAAYQARGMSGAGWLGVAGLLSIGLGVIVFAGWPLSTLWVVGVLYGVRMVSAGVAMIALGSAPERPEHVGFDRPMHPT